MLVGRFGRPGLLGLAARTAVVAGTAGAVGNAIRRRQMNQEVTSEDARAWESQQQAATEAAADQAAAAARYQSAAPIDVAGQLERLAALRQQGVLSQAEFDTEKSKILSM